MTCTRKSLSPLWGFSARRIRNSALPVVLALFAALPSQADILSIRAAGPTAPAGTIAQLQVSLTEPKPIVTGSGRLRFASTLLPTAQGASLFSPTGNVCGAAVLGKNSMDVSVDSPDELFGTQVGAPMVVLDMAVSPTAGTGQQSLLTLDATRSVFYDTLGQPYTDEIHSGEFVVGGTLTISSVKPGAGLLPAGSAVTITGTGFDQSSKVNIEGAEISKPTFVNSTQIKVTLVAAADLYGKRVRVTNTDGSQATYYSYQRTTPQVRSANPTLAATLPLFSTLTYVDAFVSTPTGKTSLALAFQNTASGPGHVSLTLFKSDGTQLGQTSFTVSSQKWMLRSTSEYLPGITPPAGSYWEATSDRPVQMLGLTVDRTTNAVTPVPPSLTRP